GCSDGTYLRPLRKRSQIWKSYQSRAQRDEAPLESQPAARARPRAGRAQEDLRLHGVHSFGEGHQSQLTPRQEGRGKPLPSSEDSAFQPSTSAIRSISTDTFRGRRATSTVARAGGQSPKKRA